MKLWQRSPPIFSWAAITLGIRSQSHILVTYIFCDYCSPFLIFVFSVLAVGSHILDTLPMLLSGRLPAALEFQVSLKQEDCDSLARSDSRKIFTKLSVHRFDHQENGGDLEVPTYHLAEGD